MDDAREKAPTAGPGIRPASIPADTPFGKKVHEAHDEFLDAKKADGEPLTYKHYVDKLLAVLHDEASWRPCCSLADRGGRRRLQILSDARQGMGEGQNAGEGTRSLLRESPSPRRARPFSTGAGKPGRRHITYSPWADIKYLKELGRERLVTDEEFAALLKHCVTCRYADRPEHKPEACTYCESDAEFRQILVVMRHTTMRPGELRQLEWDEVEFSAHRIAMSAKKIKTRNRRSITLLPEVEKLLEGRRQRAIAEHGQASGLVFPTMDGEEWNRVSFSQRFRRLRQRAVAAGDMQNEKKGEKLVLYSTRHTRITELFVQGNEQHVVMAESGHIVPMTTEPLQTPGG